MAKKIKKEEACVDTEMMTQRFEKIYSDFINNAPNSEILSELGDIENEKFVEYNTWIPLRGLIMLKSYLSDGDDATQVACRARVAGVTNSCSNDLVEAFHMMLEGEITGIDLIDMAKESGDAEWEKTLYIRIIAQIVTIIEMGASRKFGYAEAVKALDRVLKEARRRV